jgi:hypothetical protein
MINMHALHNKALNKITPGKNYCEELPGVQHSWASRHAVRIAVYHARLGKPARGAIRLRKTPLAIRTESFFAETLRFRIGRIIAAVRIVEGRGSLFSAAVLIAGQVEGALPPLGRRRAGIAVNEGGGGAGGGAGGRSRRS